MAYTLEQMRDFARVALNKLTRDALEQIVLDVHLTVALDFYSRIYRCFQANKTDWSPNGTIYQFDLPSDFLGRLWCQVGTGEQSWARHVDPMQLTKYREQGLGFSGMASYLYALDDAEEQIQIFPVVASGTTITFRYFSVAALPATGGASFPAVVELEPFLRAIRWAYLAHEERFGEAEVVRNTLVAETAMIHRRLQQRGLMPHGKSQGQRTG